jgi:transposase-like protein
MPKRRLRSFSAEFKAWIVVQVLTGAHTPAELYRQHGLKAELATRWKDTTLDRLPTLFQGEDQQGGSQARIAEVERMVERLTIELEVAK